MIQKLWKKDIGWDDPIDGEDLAEWVDYHGDIKDISKIEIPRWFGGTRESLVELHTFCDGSQIAYGAATYIRTTGEKTKVSLMMAKTRVAPVKQLSTPRIELCAAELGAELMNVLADKIGIGMQACYLWTDSSIVLQWLKKEPAKLQTFVANRVAKIQEITREAQWRHVATIQRIWLLVVALRLNLVICGGMDHVGCKSPRTNGRLVKSISLLTKRRNLPKK